MPLTKLIRKKRDGEALSDEEILRFVQGASDGSIPDYQLSALLMAIYFQGMSAHETARLTAAMASSGRKLDLSGVSLPKVDKHSTGGVGDKVSLILAPVVASCGIAVPMISGRGLGHTGGTVDKLESIPGFRTSLSLVEIGRQVDRIGFAMGAQSDDLAPADRKLYALRDVTATVESLPLITASILSKKFTEDLDALVMDVKVGRGAFMKTLDEARALAQSICDVSKAGGLPCRAFLTRMDAPLGRRIGNWLEVCESVRVLRGEEEPPLLFDLVVELSGACIHAAGAAGSHAEGNERARRAIADGSAWEKFVQMVECQGGDLHVLEHAAEPQFTEVIMSDRQGFVTAIDALSMGLLSIELGAGRRFVSDGIAPDAGIVLFRQLGEWVERGEPLCGVVMRRVGVAVIADEVRSCFSIGAEAPRQQEMILDIL